MRYYKVTESQLDGLDESHRDVTKAYAGAAFLGALSLDLLRDILTSSAMTAVQSAIWGTATAFTAIFALLLLFRGMRKDTLGKKQVQKIKDDQDFTR